MNIKNTIQETSSLSLCFDVAKVVLWSLCLQMSKEIIKGLNKSLDNISQKN